MKHHKGSPRLTLLIAASLAAFGYAHAAAGAPHEHQTAKQPSPPRQWQKMPPTEEQAEFKLPESRKTAVPTTSTVRSAAMVRPLAATPECKDMDKLATYSGAALANYLVQLPDYECTYGLFSLTAAQAAKAYTPANLNAVASRFAQEASSYNASNMNLVNLALYLRAGYYLAGSGTVAEPPASLLGVLRPAIKGLANGNQLFKANAQAGTTASEVMKLITNTHDEAAYLPEMRSLVQRYTNTASNPNAAAALKDYATGGGFTGVLTVLFYAHGRPEGRALLENDPSYAVALNNFVNGNKAALLGGDAAYQLGDAARENFRFFQYSGLKSTLKPMVKNMLASTSMTGADSDLWLAAAESVKYYDNANCAEYGTCNYETKLADAVLKGSYTCSPTIRIRAQDMSTAQMQSSCALLQAEESYFHQMLQTNNTPVANDRNTSLEVVVFDDYANYAKYASVIYGIDTNNGGMYLEGNPAAAGNQARFIAHEASWLRPEFKIWNLEHEYIHYLDGRFDMQGDFGAGTAKPTVWWIEGVAEYLSLRNNNQASIDAARLGTYKLSQIFGNTYDMADYTNRAYRWGYMATRFMVERHRPDVDAVVARFRQGDYTGYQNYMTQIGTRYDTEFANWVKTATTTGQPPLPSLPTLPACSSASYLGKGCAIKGLTSATQSYVYINLPAGARNLKLYTTGGTGDSDLYVGLDRYPTTSSYDYASAQTGNTDSVSIASPQSGKWYYIMLKARSAFSGVNINATYD